MMDAAFQEKPDDRADELRAALGRIDALEQQVRRLNRTLNRVIARARRDELDEGQELAPRPPGEWVSLKQGAAEAGRGLSTLYDLRKSGAVPEHHEGGRVLVERTAIAAVVAARKARA
jgi:hypothetical protein